MRNLARLLLLLAAFSFLTTLTQAQPVTIPPGVDLWTTDQSCFSGIELPPIPQDFFYPGCLPFEGTVYFFVGQPLQTNPPSALGNVDVIVERQDQLELPALGSTDQVPIEIVALSLTSCEPIVVTNLEGEVQQWNVQVTLSQDVSPPVGQLEATLECPSGGTFTAEAPIVPKFIFTRIFPPTTDPPLELEYSSPVIIHLSHNESFGNFSTAPGPDFQPIISDGLTQVDHDLDPLTPMIPLPPSGENFFPGLADLPCTPSLPPLCQGLQMTNWRDPDGVFNVFWQPAMLPLVPVGATCLDGDACMMMSSSCALSLGGDYQGDGVLCNGLSCLPPDLPGISFGQVDFIYDSSPVPFSNTGRLEVNVPTLSGSTGLTSGYINLWTNLGWVVQNLWFSTTDDVNDLAYYFCISPFNGVPLPAMSVYWSVTSSPIADFDDGPRSIYPVLPVPWGAEGRDLPASGLTEEPIAPGTLVFDLAGLSEVLTQPNKSNVQAANNQCFPMAIANSLQYLEDRYGLPVPQPHVPGLKGDSSLVGHLDSTANRSVTSRSNGSGVGDGQMLTGKFRYMKENNLKGKIVTKHQDGMIPSGDYTAHGITSKDQSDSGRVSWQWICDELAKGEDVEVCWTYYDTNGVAHGGHAVRVFECGQTLGIPWIGYLHDRLQTDDDPGDSLGLECVRAAMVDLDGDSIPNAGMVSREIDFAVSESADTDQDGVTNGIDNAPNIFNPGQEDLDNNGIGDVVGSPDLVTNSIAPFDLTAGEQVQSGYFQNPAPPSGDHKDLWFIGTATATAGGDARIVVSFSYKNEDGTETSVAPKDTTDIPAGKTFEIFGSTTIDECPDSVSVTIAALTGSAADVSGELHHICYSPLDITCCVGNVGDANCLGGDEPTVADVGVIVDFLFISGSPLCCLEEADANTSGGGTPGTGDITVADIGIIVDHLFITGAPLSPCP